MNNNKHIDPSELPFVAPCRKVSDDAPLRWLQKGVDDLRAAPRQSLVYGFLTVLLSWVMTFATMQFGNIGLYLGLVSGFVFAGPWLALTLYAISLRLERGEKVSLRLSIRDAGSVIGSAMIFAVILVIVLLVWARAANTMYIFFPEVANPSYSQLAVFLVAGISVGALFCLVVFAVSAFSLPMLIDRQADAVTAVVTSVNAVMRNKYPLMLWAVMISCLIMIAALTAWVALVVIMPVLGHASWHAYRETIDAEQWPANELKK
jgi:uncharacterized membrane protein